MRIVAGEKRGTNIMSPKGTDTRPTLERVRESLFGILQYDIPDAQVLDLFGGSGALGLEAVSRGAAHALINDSSREAARVIEANIKKLGFEDRVSLMNGDCIICIKRCAAAGRRFDVVFLDPPYKSGLIKASMEALAATGTLNRGFVIAAEHASNMTLETPSGFVLRDMRRYGEAAISFFAEAEEK